MRRRRLGPAALAAALLLPASLAGAVIVQQGGLTVRVSGRIAPHRLPRTGTAPVRVSVAGRIGTAEAAPPPRLETLKIELNRHGHLDPTALPPCPYDRIQPASSARALAACRASLVGRGRFETEVLLAGENPYPTQGQLLVFSGRRQGRPVLFGHIYASKPFASSFVIVFAIEERSRGPYGAVLTASLPAALGAWGYLTGIRLTLGGGSGDARGYLRAGCPAPAGFPGASFPLARTTFGFAGEQTLAGTITENCQVR